ncbi:uncharacterized protein LOC122848378 [Aphidius gifuensis]|uniref:uncharacterized protein LOC122848378 n=1 Tax=Aphidius gifuensis TaxID=684658 RepID=UPI001CDC506F|nr:uncharacterized protein LOC122848378 [Aphidius gifuensis]
MSIKYKMYLQTVVILVIAVTFASIECNQMDKLERTSSNTKHQERSQSLKSPGLFKEINKRQTSDPWIVKEFTGREEIMKMHAYIVRDENIPTCCKPAQAASNKRYFMCTGAILTLRHAITTASCMHFADIYEHHIDANLALQIGGITSKPYVIRINRYEMHPKYAYDVDAKDHPTHNLALLYLACSIIPGTAVVPKLPRGIFDDVGHMCCGNECNVITIVQTSKNLQFARILKAKNLPSPRHELPDELDVKNTVSGGYHGSFDSLSDTNPPIRAGRSIKLRSSLTSTSRRSRSDDSTETKKNSKPRNSKKRKKAKNNVDKNVKSTTAKPSAKENNSRRQAEISGSGNSSKNIDKSDMEDYNKLESVITAQLTDMNEASIQKFAQEIVDATMKQLNNTVGKNNSVLTTNKSEEASLLAKIISNSNGNSSIDDIARAFTTVITRNNNALSASSGLNVNLDELPSPPAKYVKCPPLGTPIIIENTLVGMVAYTCDDVQSWVEWKYVSISQNLIWIQKRLNSIQRHAPPVDCENKGNNWQNDENVGPRSLTNTRNNLSWPPRSVPKQKSAYDEYLERIRPIRQFGDDNVVNNTYQAGNADELLRYQKMEQTRRMNERNLRFGNDDNQGNTCYRRADGSLDCRTTANKYALQ